MKISTSWPLVRYEKRFCFLVALFEFFLIDVCLTGFTDGSVVLTKGDITRDRHSKTVTLHEGISPITGLAFRQVAKITHLFVATLEKVYVSLLSVR